MGKLSTKKQQRQKLKQQQKKKLQHQRQNQPVAIAESETESEVSISLFGSFILAFSRLLTNKTAMLIFFLLYGAPVLQVVAQVMAEEESDSQLSHNRKKADSSRNSNNPIPEDKKMTGPSLSYEQVLAEIRKASQRDDKKMGLAIAEEGLKVAKTPQQKITLLTYKLSILQFYEKDEEFYEIADTILKIDPNNEETLSRVTRSYSRKYKPGDKGCRENVIKYGKKLENPKTANGYAARGAYLQTIALNPETNSIINIELFADAAKLFEKAVEMEPTNPSYKNALDACKEDYQNSLNFIDESNLFLSRNLEYVARVGSSSLDSFSSNLAVFSKEDIQAAISASFPLIIKHNTSQKKTSKEIPRVVYIGNKKDFFSYEAKFDPDNFVIKMVRSENQALSKTVPENLQNQVTAIILPTGKIIKTPKLLRSNLPKNLDSQLNHEETISLIDEALKKNDHEKIIELADQGLKNNLTSEQKLELLTRKMRALEKKLPETKQKFLSTSEEILVIEPNHEFTIANLLRSYIKHPVLDGREKFPLLQEYEKKLKATKHPLGLSARAIFLFSLAESDARTQVMNLELMADAIDLFRAVIEMAPENPIYAIEFDTLNRKYQIFLENKDRSNIFNVAFVKYTMAVGFSSIESFHSNTPVFSKSELNSAIENGYALKMVENSVYSASKNILIPRKRNGKQTFYSYQGVLDEDNFVLKITENQLVLAIDIEDLTENVAAIIVPGEGVISSPEHFRRILLEENARTTHEKIVHHNENQDQNMEYGSEQQYAERVLEAKQEWTLDMSTMMYFGLPALVIVALLKLTGKLSMPGWTKAKVSPQNEVHNFSKEKPNKAAHVSDILNVLNDYFQHFTDSRWILENQKFVLRISEWKQKLDLATTKFKPIYPAISEIILKDSMVDQLFARQLAVGFGSQNITKKQEDDLIIVEINFQDVEIDVNLLDNNLYQAMTTLIDASDENQSSILYEDIFKKLLEIQVKSIELLKKLENLDEDFSNFKNKGNKHKEHEDKSVKRNASALITQCENFFKIYDQLEEYIKRIEPLANQASTSTAGASLAVVKKLEEEVKKEENALKEIAENLRTSEEGIPKAELAFKTSMLNFDNRMTKKTKPQVKSSSAAIIQGLEGKSIQKPVQTDTKEKEEKIKRLEKLKQEKDKLDEAMRKLKHQQELSKQAKIKVDEAVRKFELKQKVQDHLENYTPLKSGVDSLDFLREASDLNKAVKKNYLEDCLDKTEQQLVVQFAEIGGIMRAMHAIAMTQANVKKRYPQAINVVDTKKAYAARNGMMHNYQRIIALNVDELDKASIELLKKDPINALKNSKLEPITFLHKLLDGSQNVPKLQEAIKEMKRGAREQKANEVCQFIRDRFINLIQFEQIIKKVFLSDADESDQLYRKCGILHQAINTCMCYLGQALKDLHKLDEKQYNKIFKQLRNFNPKFIRDIPVLWANDRQKKSNQKGTFFEKIKGDVGHYFKDESENFEDSSMYKLFYASDPKELSSMVSLSAEFFRKNEAFFDSFSPEKINNKSNDSKMESSESRESWDENNNNVDRSFTM